MRYYFSFLLVSLLTVTLHAQDGPPVTLHIGDPAPPLQIKKWLKGDPILSFEKGRVYVLEFWATWCAPCRAAMPRLSVLAKKYQENVTVIGVDIYEEQAFIKKDIKAFVDSMGSRMDYTVAVQDSNFMAVNWYNATGNTGIPGTVIIDQKGRLAWIGHPAQLEQVLPDILNHTWDITKELTRQIEERYIDSLDREANFDLAPYWPDNQKPGDLGKPNLALWAIEEMVKKEPRLKYARSVGYQTFTALLKTNQSKALEYAREAIAATTHKEEIYDIIIDGIATYMDRLTISPEVYRLGAESFEACIELIAYPELLSMHKQYSKLAEFYSRSNNKPKAIAAQQKAIEALKSKPGFSSKDLAALEGRLKQYKKM